MPRVVFSSGRKSFLLLILAVAMVGGAWWWQRLPPEPKAHGQPFSEWVTRHGNRQNPAQNIGELHTFGPGVVPWLIYTVERDWHPFERHGPLPFDRAPDWLRRRVPEKWGGLHPPSGQASREDAIWALGQLGPQAAAAIPILARCLAQANEDKDTLGETAEALNTMGPESWPVVHQILEHGNQIPRCSLLLTLSDRLKAVEPSVTKAEADNIMTALLKACGDPDALIRVCAASGLGSCRRERPDLIALDSAIPVIIKLLSDSDAHVKQYAASILDGDPANAAPAIPRLIELLNDPDDGVRTTAAGVLGGVDSSEKLSANRLRTMFLRDPNALCRASAGNALKVLGLSPSEESAGPDAPAAR